MTLTEIRRQNLRAVARKFGGITNLGKRIGRSQAQLSHSIGANPVRAIGDKLSAYIEHILDLPTGWLDQIKINIDDIVIELPTPIHTNKNSQNNIIMY